MLNRDDEDRIAAAVSAAEAQTSGEILVVLAEEVSKYREIPLAWAAAAALGVAPIVASLAMRPLLGLLTDPWTAQISPAAGLSIAVAAYGAAQIALFLVVLAIVHIPAVRRAVTPRVLKAHRVGQAAHRQFAAIAARAVGSETGVMIFVALQDHQVRVEAHAGAHQACGEAPWVEAAAAVATAMKAGADPTVGIVRAVEIIGAALATHYPAGGASHHDFGDRPIEI